MSGAPPGERSSGLTYVPLSPLAQEAGLDHRNINQIPGDLPKDTHPPINIFEDGIQILRLRGDFAVWKTVPYSGDSLDAMFAVVAGELLEVLNHVGIVDAGNDLDVEEQRVGAVEG